MVQSLLNFSFLANRGKYRYGVVCTKNNLDWNFLKKYSCSYKLVMFHCLSHRRKILTGVSVNRTHQLLCNAAIVGREFIVETHIARIFLQKTRVARNIFAKIFRT